MRILANTYWLPVRGKLYIATHTRIHSCHMSLYIGIEAVGLRHSAAVASDGQGRLYYAARHVGEPIILHSTDRVLIRQRLFGLLKAICDASGSSLDELRNSVVCIGIAGAAFSSELFDLRREFDQIDLKVGKLICRTDTDIILTSHLKSCDGSIIQCASGAAIMISLPGRIVRTGGWGPAISENGSGYWIGRQAIAAIANELFLGSPHSQLWYQIDDWLKDPAKSDYPDLKLLCIRWLQYLEQHGDMRPQPDTRSLFLAFINQTSVEHHHAWRCMVSTLAQPVIAAAEAGEPIALGIIDQCLNHLVEQYVRCCATANDHKPVLPIVLYGGILNHHTNLSSQLQARLRSHFEADLAFVSKHTDRTLRPVCGALLLALGNSTDAELRLPSREVIDNVGDSVRRFEDDLGGMKND